MIEPGFPSLTDESDPAAKSLNGPEMRNGLPDQRKFSTSIRSLPLWPVCV